MSALPVLSFLALNFLLGLLLLFLTEVELPPHTLGHLLVLLGDIHRLDAPGEVLVVDIDGIVRVLRLRVGLLPDLGLVHVLIDLEERDLDADQAPLHVNNSVDGALCLVDQSKQLNRVSEVQQIAAGD